MKKRLILIISALSVWGFAAMGIAAGSPPLVTDNLQKLGMHLYNDKNLSLYQNQSCRTCHHHLAGFADLKNHLNPYTSVVSTGSDGVSKGGRNAPTSAYAGFSPPLDQLVSGEYVGGLFWDGRADGSVLQDPLAEQAQGPPLNLVEMAMPSKDAVISVIRNSTYVNLWYKVYGNNSLTDIDQAYNNFGRAVAAYERSADVTKFTSKFDVNRNQFTASEENGLALFQESCARCHSTTAAFGASAPLFTNYQYANIGVPANPLVPSAPDLGLGVTVNESNQNGKFKIPTLRNIAMSAPYSHNGSFPTIEAMVGFLNDRSGVSPEVADNIDPNVGNFNLTTAQVHDIVAFLQTLTDDY
jgi:cytochrome c peroxidase